MSAEDEQVVREQLVLGCSAIHEHHGFQSDAAHDCQAPEADVALDSLITQRDQALAEVERLKAEIENERRAVRTLEAVKHENERLRAALGGGGDAEDISSL